MGRLTLKNSKDIQEYYKYLETHNKDEKIKKAAVDLLIEQRQLNSIFSFLYDHEKLGLSHDNISDLLNVFLSFDHATLNRCGGHFAVLLNDTYIRSHFRSDILTKLDETIDDIETYYSIYKTHRELFTEDYFVNKFITFASDENTNKELISGCVQRYTKDGILSKKAILELQQFLPNSQIIKLSHKDYAKKYIVCMSRLLEERNANEQEFLRFITDNENIEDSFITDSIVAYIKSKEDKEDFESVSGIFKNSKHLSSTARKDLFDMILKSKNESAISMLTVTYEDENELTNKEYSKIIKYIEDKKDVSLAYFILRNSKEKIDKDNYNRLLDIIVKSSSKKYIALCALFIDNSLIKPIFKNMNNLYIYLRSLDNVDDYDYGLIDQKYMELLQKESDDKKEKVKKEVDKNIKEYKMVKPKKKDKK